MKKSLVLVSSLLIFLFILTGYQSEQAEDTIKIGVTVPLTGPVEAFGKWTLNGLELAKQEINARGGINGKEIEFIVEDDKCQAKEAITNTQKLLNVDEVKIIFSTCSAVTPAVATVTKDKAITFSPVAFSNTVIEEAYSNVFTTQPPMEEEMKVLADHIYDVEGLEKISVMYVKLEIGVSYNDWFQKAFENKGGEILAVETFELLDSDFRTQLTKISSTESEGLMIIMSGKALGDIVKQSNELGMELKYFGTTIAQSPIFLQAAGDFAEGFKFTYPLKVGEIETSTSYREAYVENYEEEPEMISTNSYDILLILEKVLQSCPNKELECMNTATREIQEFEGASGKITFRSDGMVEKSVYMKSVENGKFVYLK